MNMSNKSLALLLVAAIVISLAGTFISLNKLNQIVVILPTKEVTGRALIGTGQVNLTIEENASCTVDTDVLFGNGQAGDFYLDTQTDNSPDFNNCVGGSTDCRGIVINNTGNVVLNISFNSTENASGFLLGGAAVNRFRHFINDSGDGSDTDGCTTPGASSWTTIQRLVDTDICRFLNFSTDRNTVTIEFQVNITVDTPVGNKTTDINVECIDAS